MSQAVVGPSPVSQQWSWNDGSSRRRGAASADPRERSIETQIIRRVSDRPDAAIDTAAVGSSPCALDPGADPKVWLFGVAEHWNAELLGWHVAKRGTRFEALQAVGMAARNQFDRVDADAARGLALRHDHGSNFMSDAFQKQIRSWGIAPSYAFVGEPQTNGVIERPPAPPSAGRDEARRDRSDPRSRAQCRTRAAR
jgi:hypothetical protein